MEEQSINFKTAKLAKEKGFTTHTITTKFTNNYLLGGKNVMINETCIFLWMCELQKWLREVHNIHVIARFYKDDISNETDEDIEFQILWENELLDVKDDYNIFSDNTYYHTYEKALEIGLQEALKLIK